MHRVYASKATKTRRFILAVPFLTTLNNRAAWFLGISGYSGIHELERGNSYRLPGFPIRDALRTDERALGSSVERRVPAVGLERGLSHNA
jgi:hypothetical protein